MCIMGKVILICLVALSAAAVVLASTRIVGGQVAPIGAFPYQVSIRRNGYHFCGGSIINPTTILTASHCTYGRSHSGITVVVGSNYLSSGGEIYQVNQVIDHPAYHKPTMLNDITILKVSEPIQYSETVQPIKLATSDVPVHTQTVLSGWGLTSYPGSLPNSMHYIKLQTIDLNACAIYLQGTQPVFKAHICTASYPGAGGCQGDSGGPLVANGVQIGVVSWGVPCALGRPDVFTSVHFYADFIEQHS